MTREKKSQESGVAQVMEAMLHSLFSGFIEKSEGSGDEAQDLIAILSTARRQLGEKKNLTGENEQMLDLLLQLVGMTEEERVLILEQTEDGKDWPKRLPPLSLICPHCHKAVTIKYKWGGRLRYRDSLWRGYAFCSQPCFFGFQKKTGVSARSGGVLSKAIQESLVANRTQILDLRERRLAEALALKKIKREETMEKARQRRLENPGSGRNRLTNTDLLATNLKRRAR